MEADHGHQHRAQFALEFGQTIPFFVIELVISGQNLQLNGNLDQILHHLNASRNPVPPVPILVPLFHYGTYRVGQQKVYNRGFSYYTNYPLSILMKICTLVV